MLPTKSRLKLRSAVAMTRAIVATVATVATMLGGVLPAGAQGAQPKMANRDAAEVLDSIELPGQSEPDDLGKRARSYTVALSATDVLSFFRTTLEAAGWDERAVARARVNNRESGGDMTDGGNEASGTGTSDVESGQVGTDTTERLSAPLTGRWRRSGATLRIAIRETRSSDPVTHGGVARQSTVTLRVRPGS